MRYRRVFIDDENIEVFWQEILDNVNEVLETMQTTTEKTEFESAEACTPFPKSAERQCQFLWV